MGLIQMIRSAFVKQPIPRRSYMAAKSDNITSSWLAPFTSQNMEARYALRTIRARARELSRNNDYFRKYLKLCVTNIIGPDGIRLQCRAKNPNGQLDKAANAMVEEAWYEWGRSCTVDGMFTWPDLQAHLIEAIARDGETIVRKIENYDNPSRFALQVMESDYLDEELYDDKPDGAGYRRIMGVKVDPWGRPAEYWFYKTHPGDWYYLTYGARDYQRFPAGEIIHPFMVERCGQTRGIPWAASAMFRLNMVGEYEVAALVASRVGASKMGFFTSEANVAAQYTGQDKDSDGNIVNEAVPGTYEQLPPGMDFKPFEPEYPSDNFQPFIKCTLRGAAAGLNVSYNSLASDLEGVNFSSIRAGVLEERDWWRFLQRWTVANIHQKVYEAWLRSALLSRAINLPFRAYDKLARPRWQPRGWEWVDPSNDVEADRMSVRLGFKTRTEVVGEQGRDFEDTLAQLAEEEKLAKSYGIDLTTEKSYAGMDLNSEKKPVGEEGKKKAENAE